jgi:hypothetical protein
MSGKSVLTEKPREAPSRNTLKACSSGSRRMASPDTNGLAQDECGAS